MRIESNARKSWNFISRAWFILLRCRVYQVVRKLYVQIEQISFRPTLGPFCLKPADVLQLICRKGGEGVRINVCLATKAARLVCKFVFSFFFFLLSETLPFFSFVLDLILCYL